MWLDRPSDVPRHLFDGFDSRGLKTFRVIYGTNIVEASFGEIEKAIFSNGGYSEIKWQGILLNKIGRLNERKRAEASGGGAGHYDLERQRMANALMQPGEPLPHPHLPPLAPLSQAEQGIDYFHSEIRRRAERTATQVAVTITPTENLEQNPRLNLALKITFPP